MVNLYYIVGKIAIVGALLVSLGEPFWANVLWGFSNPYILYTSYKNKDKVLIEVYAIFTIIAFYGIWNLWPY